ncbi:MAG: citramalate synthase [Planctomycetota bacterium]|nr:citramalate synthase [Planctomycetota bacterium]
MKDKKTRIEIYDTTLRDGTQAEGVWLSLEDKLLIVEKLDSFGVDYIEGGYPLSNPKDKAFFAEVSRKPPAHAKITAFGMTRRKGVKVEDDEGVKALMDSKAPVVTIVGKSWDLHVKKVLRASPQENLDMISESLAALSEAGREVFFDAEHFFDGYRADADYAIGTLEAAVTGKASRLVLCDTNGGSLPEFIGRVVEDVRRRFPDVVIGIHCHNDSALGVANTLAAVASGARHVQGTINGIGERCGNADLTSIIPNLVLKCGYECLTEGATQRLTEVSRYFSEVANLPLQENQPFVGLAAFAHKGGMHVHAVRRSTAAYEHIDPAEVGNTRRILISELAGATSVAVKTDKKFNLDQDKNLAKKVIRTVQEMENQGYQFEAAEASFNLLVRKTLGGKWYRRFWELDHYRCVILQTGQNSTSTEAIVKIGIDGKSVHTVSEGDGPVNALDGALRKALLPHYPSIDQLQLIDYKVRVVNPKAGTAAKVRVVIEFHDTTCGYFGTVGVDENIIQASWKALSDAIEYKLLNEQEKKNVE